MTNQPVSKDFKTQTTSTKLCHFVFLPEMFSATRCQSTVCPFGIVSEQPFSLAQTAFTSVQMCFCQTGEFAVLLLDFLLRMTKNCMFCTFGDCFCVCSTQHSFFNQLWTTKAKEATHHFTCVDPGGRERNNSRVMCANDWKMLLFFAIYWHEMLFLRRKIDSEVDTRTASPNSSRNITESIFFYPPPQGSTDKPCSVPIQVKLSSVCSQIRLLCGYTQWRLWVKGLTILALQLLCIIHQYILPWSTPRPSGCAQPQSSSFMQTEQASHWLVPYHVKLMDPTLHGINTPFGNKKFMKCKCTLIVSIYVVRNWRKRPSDYDGSRFCEFRDSVSCESLEHWGATVVPELLSEKSWHERIFASSLNPSAQLPSKLNSLPESGWTCDPVLALVGEDHVCFCDGSYTLCKISQVLSQGNLGMGSCGFATTRQKFICSHFCATIVVCFHFHPRVRNGTTLTSVLWQSFQSACPHDSVFSGRELPLPKPSIFVRTARAVRCSIWSTFYNRSHLLVWTPQVSLKFIQIGAKWTAFRLPAKNGRAGRVFVSVVILRQFPSVHVADDILAGTRSCRAWIVLRFGLILSTFSAPRFSNCWFSWK